LIKEIHAKLLQSGRGSNMTPGEFRKSQNWIGSAGSTINNASYIPPSVTDMNNAMNELEEYFYSKENGSFLVKVALIHAQFETIHPFLDGNGRTGRLLIAFLLCQQKILAKPLLYLSYYFKENRNEYYERLTAIRKDGDWENWLKFFLSGVAVVADEAILSAKQIIELREKTTGIISLSSISTNYMRLVDYLFLKPIIQITEIQKEFEISHQLATRMVKKLEELLIVEDISQNRVRNKKYLFTEYFRILQRGT
jgi:Fic family protein